MASHLKILMIPFMAPSHIIPMMDMAKLLAKRGLNITIIVTPLTAARFSSVINRAMLSGLSIRLLQVPFPSEEAGLPPGCETFECIPSYGHVRNFHVAISLLKRPVEDELKSLNYTPTCIICDKHIPWTADTCKKFQIPRIIFDGMSCFAQMVTHQLYVSGIHENRPSMEPFVVPGLPDQVEFCKAQLPGMFNPGSLDINDFRAQVRETELQAYGAVVNSFEELEKRYADEYRNVMGGKVWCIGPLSLSINDQVDRAERGSRASVDADRCLKWLDGKNPGSVIYACLGSISRLPRDEFIELALGLELGNHPFILVVKGGDDSIEEWIREEGYEERVQERGIVIRGWAPQVVILSHPSVGGFLTHCGWNSTLEGISMGVPMITWPRFAEQFLNEKLVVEILGTGVGVGAKGVVHFGEEKNWDQDNNKVRRDGIRAAIEMVMDHEGGQGLERRKRAQAIAGTAKRSLENGGSSYRNITLLIEEIDQLSKNKTRVSDL